MISRLSLAACHPTSARAGAPTQMETGDVIHASRLRYHAFLREESRGRGCNRFRCRLQRALGADDHGEWLDTVSRGRRSPRRVDPPSTLFQDLLLSEFVIGDLILDNPNVCYEIGVRQALRAGGCGHYLRVTRTATLRHRRAARGALHTQGRKARPSTRRHQRKTLQGAIEATLGAWRGRRASPVYQQLPNLQEPNWKSLKVGDINEFARSSSRSSHGTP
jgi:hypothetical protein